VSWNSNTGVDAVMAGVPAVVMDPGGMAWPVASHDITETVRPNRDRWYDRLAMCQWSMDEMVSGECWEHVREIL